MEVYVCVCVCICVYVCLFMSHKNGRVCVYVSVCICVYVCVTYKWKCVCVPQVKLIFILVIWNVDPRMLALMQSHAGRTEPPGRP